MAMILPFARKRRDSTLECFFSMSPEQQHLRIRQLSRGNISDDQIAKLVRRSVSEVRRILGEPIANPLRVRSTSGAAD